MNAIRDDEANKIEAMGRSIERSLDRLQISEWSMPVLDTISNYLAPNEAFVCCRSIGDRISGSAKKHVLRKISNAFSAKKIG